MRSCTSITPLFRGRSHFFRYRSYYIFPDAKCIRRIIIKRYLAALLSGLLFGLGLAISEMVNPQKVLGFLDVTGSWDPSLMFVLGSVLMVTIVAFLPITRMVTE